MDHYPLVATEPLFYNDLLWVRIMNTNHVKVNLDSRNRIPLTKVLGDCSAKTFDMYWEKDKLILVP